MPRKARRRTAVRLMKRTPGAEKYESISCLGRPPGLVAGYSGDNFDVPSAHVTTSTACASGGDITQGRGA